MALTDSPATCPSCQESNYVDLGACLLPVECASDPQSSLVANIAKKLEGSRFYRCQTCDLCFRWPQLNESDLEQLYGSLPDRYWEYDPSQVGSWKSALRYLQKNTRSQEKVEVLDVGAFDGAFLSLLPDSWTKSAIEPCVAAKKYLSDKSISWLGPFIETLALEDYAHRFDVVTMFDVFEHLPHPSRTLKSLGQFLKDDGLLLISTGNADHWSWQLMKSEHWYLHSAQHLCVGSENYFRKQSAHTGLTVRDLIKHPHQIGGCADRARQTIETVHAWARINKNRKLMGALQRIPKMNHLVHKSGSPFTTTLKDHVLVVLAPIEGPGRRPGN